MEFEFMRDRASVVWDKKCERWKKVNRIDQSSSSWLLARQMKNMKESENSK